MPSFLIVTTKALLLASFLVVFLISYLHTQQTHKMEHRLGIGIPSALSKMISMHILVTLTFLIAFSVLFIL